MKYYLNWLYENHIWADDSGSSGLLTVDFPHRTISFDYEEEFINYMDAYILTDQDKEKKNDNN